jgi:hypothetical protein
MVSIDVLTRFKTQIAIAWLGILFLSFVVDPKAMKRFVAPLRYWYRVVFKPVFDQLTRASKRENSK